MVIVTTQNAVGLDAKTGETLWREPRARTEYGTAVPWQSGGKTFAVLLAGRAHCFDPKTGSNSWGRVSGGDGASPVIVGEHMAVKGRSYLTLYRLDASFPERLWRVKFHDQFTSPTIHDGHVYVFGGAYRDRNPTRAVCVEIASGEICWDENVGPFEFSSATVADGKLILIGRDTLYLLKATPEKYTVLGKARLGLRSWSSIGFVDGRIYVRTQKRVVCYDLRK